MKPQIDLNCKICNKTFSILLSDYKYKNKTQKNIYCSQRCANISKKDSVTEPCGHCNKLVTRFISDKISSKSGHIFCSRSCSTYYRNQHKTTGFQRSKLEIFMEDFIKSKFPHTNVAFNNSNIIGYELDVYFPDYKLAIEYNGIVHYEPIYGTDRLTKIQFNDKQKILLCAQNGIELIVLNCNGISAKKINSIISNEVFSILTSIINP